MRPYNLQIKKRGINEILIFIRYSEKKWDMILETKKYHSFLAKWFRGLLVPLLMIGELFFSNLL